MNGVGIEVLAEPIFVRGVSPSKVGTHRAWLAHLAPEPLMWRFVFCGNGEGIEALAKPIFVRAKPFYGSGTAAPFNGWHAPCLAGAPCAYNISMASP